jgi:Protein of unknown function (DUF3562)
MDAPINSPVRQKADEAHRLEMLAQETDTSVNLVKAIYLEQLKSLEQDAKVRTFLAVIAMRRTRLILRDLESKESAVDMH